MHMLRLFKKKRIYLDYAAATPTRRVVLKRMLSYFTEHFANAGAIHQEGVAINNAVKEARKEMAQTLRIRPQGIVFTASGTESNNLALFGLVAKKHNSGVAYADIEVVSTHLEHASVTQVLLQLEKLGVQVKYASVDEDGMIDARQFEAYLSPKTVLVTFAYVNSEIGVIQDVGKIARIIRAYAKEMGTKIHIHLDAAQAPLWLPCALDQLGVDSLSLDAGKCYGPKGIGVLASVHSDAYDPYLFGGGQEGGLRPGTLNTPLIIGGVAALVHAQKHHEVQSMKVMKLRDFFIQKLLEIEGALLNGSLEHRVANNVNVSIKDIDAEFAVISLDAMGVACATKSACGGAKGDGSAVVRTITGDAARALSTIRFTLGEETTKAQLEETVSLLKKHVSRTRIAHANLTKE
jgi:cysteine desulfurase